MSPEQFTEYDVMPKPNNEKSVLIDVFVEKGLSFTSSLLFVKC